MYRNKKTTSLSRLETLPSILLRKINRLLDNEVDKICLSLTSKALGATVRQFWASARRSLCSGCGVYHEDDDDRRFYDWYELAMRLEGSMSESLQFCHHCLVFLPTLCFGSPVLEIDTTVCLDCIRLRLPRRPSHLIDCEGCLFVQERLDDEEEAADKVQDDNDCTSSVTHTPDDSLSADLEDKELENVACKTTAPSAGISSPGLTNAGAACLCM